MKNKLFGSLLLSVGLLFSCGGSQKLGPNTYLSELNVNSSINTITDKEKNLGWELLFNGRNLKGWHGYNGKDASACWRVKEKSLEVFTEGGKEKAVGLVTNKSYKNFVFSIEYKLTPGANSGIIFQVDENEKYDHPDETGPEFQIIDHAGWPRPLEDLQINGANYAMYAPKAKPYKPIGEWNQILLIVKDNSVTQMLNGKIIVEYEKYSEEWSQLKKSGKFAKYPDYGKFDKGYIVLQNHGTNVFYRNIKIKEL